MKKFIFLLAVLCTPLVSFSQEININVNVEEKKIAMKALNMIMGQVGKSKLILAL